MQGLCIPYRLHDIFAMWVSLRSNGLRELQTWHWVIKHSWQSLCKPKLLAKFTTKFSISKSALYFHICNYSTSLIHVLTVSHWIQNNRGTKKFRRHQSHLSPADFWSKLYRVGKKYFQKIQQFLDHIIKKNPHWDFISFRACLRSKSIWTTSKKS